MKTATLAEVTEFIIDGTHGSPERAQIGVPVLSATNVKNGRLDFSTERFAPDREHEQFKKRYVLTTGDVLLTIVGTIGRAAMVAETRPAIFQRSVAMLRPRRSVIDSRFLYYATQTEEFQYQLGRRTNQSSQAGIYLNKLKEVPVPLLPLEEQKRIAAILDQADSLRRLRQRAIDRLNTLGQSIFYEMFGDPRANPKGYPRRRFGELGEILLGKMLDKKKHRGDKSLPYLRNANVQWFSFDMSDVLEMDFWERELERYRVLPGDLLICEGGQPGRCSIWKDGAREIYYQKALHRARFNEKVARPEYVAYWLRCAVDLGMLVDSVSSATIAHLTGEKIKQLQLMLPPISEQISFSRTLAEREKDLSSMQRAQHLSAEMFSSLQHRAFRGDL
ncbi:restriction endonuclease subunit S [Thiohalocapsa sp. ML1]|uniref:restriction endonuclease subunit S n=1 Tax=Thiohalocapsa sp. ML1 TaxID=1431688 RepID=UPI0009E82C3D|nr:restriction endonuclease subunit S [Thiohalocapsa sp. ML1]